MEWTDEGIVLANRPHGEQHSVATLFTRGQGAAAGLVYGGQGRSKGPLLMAGNGVQARFRSRHDDALGHFEIELDTPRGASALADRHALSGLQAVTALLLDVLPQGAAYPQLYGATAALLDHVEDRDIFAVLLARWEVGLLATLGFALTLDRCAVSGALLEDGATLCFVSPRTGAAVTAEAGAPYRDRLLPLPPFLIDRGEPTRGDVRAALDLTGHFIDERLLAPVGKQLPDARQRLKDRL
jgi:DNA repair protein RecO (recombination protein O)